MIFINKSISLNWRQFQLSGDYANGAFIQANTATSDAATADSKALTAGFFANAAFGRANTANTNAAAADLKAVISGLFANGAYGAANTAYVHANSAYELANTLISTSVDS
jgi:hypothetical protein